MKNVALLLIAFVILSASFPPPTEAIDAGRSRSKRGGGSCLASAIQDCFDSIAKGMTMSTTCCDTLREHQSCICDVIKSRLGLDINVVNTHLKACGIAEMKC
ncbi:unnamed protein product [Microthlaspi erraticum]|uniref:Uncharacterized protein n=1 Tax=Microthlaspi erraticum TaxID=1685480 RepID=A0A6D2L123_9BRAS|nr:unnamed protein product [Microthlaspi erraticum]